MSTELRPLRLLVALALLALAPLAGAATVESLLMPGPLTQKHAQLESNCSNCHDRANRARQSELCLACHKEIAADVAGRSGLHGRMGNAGTAGQCLACHSDHHGRNFDIVGLSATQFDHSRTDFPLVGMHRALACGNCHLAGKSHRETGNTCIACHRTDDYHDAQLGNECGDCHSQVSWSGGRFDHGKTKFALTGKHQELSCGACHLGGKYKNAPQTCIGCHATDDAHRGERGEKCADCHTTSSWKTAKFDHLKETGFALLGSHAKLDCQGCHRSGRFDDKLPKDCIGCHRADDSHASRFGEKCDDCHTNDQWKPSTYDHGVRTGFPLVGAHQRANCHSCHTGIASQQKLPKDCASCHRALDPHGGKLQAACDACHTQDNWRRDITFDHDLTSYPLLGMHAVVTCAQCHRSKNFAAAPTTCNGCHAAQDVHKNTLGPNCDTCHTPNDWRIWQFDHAKQTGFALTGAHGKATCASCHRQPPGSVKMNKACVTCHRQDDRHLGQFGLQCDRCHTTTTFRGARIR